MTIVMLLYWANLSYRVKTHPRCIRIQGLSKPLEDLQLLLLAEHHLASGGTLELKDEFRLGTLKLLLDLSSHPIEPGGEFFLVPAREPYARPFLHFRLHGDGPVGHLHRGYASNDELLVFHVAGSPETEGNRNSVTHPVAILNEGTLWQILPEHFYGGVFVPLVNGGFIGGGAPPPPPHPGQTVG